LCCGPGDFLLFTEVSPTPSTTTAAGPAATTGPQGSPLDHYEPLLPLLLGPCMRVWKECYLRGVLHAQVGPEKGGGPVLNAEGCKALC
jgi:hypothetical protein